MGKVSRVENREKTKTDGTSTWLPQFRNQQKKLFCCFSDWDSRVCLWLLAYCRADRSCLCLQKKRLMSLLRPNLSTQLDFLPPPRASGQPARLPPAEKLLPCSLWSESASECTRDPRRRKTWAQQVCIPSVFPHAFYVFVTANLCFSWLGYVLGILMMAIIIILGAGITFGYFYKRYWLTRHQIKHKNRHYFLVKQQLLLSLCLRMLESSGCSFESAQVECQYELSTHPVWTTC